MTEMTYQRNTDLPDDLTKMKTLDDNPRVFVLGRGELPADYPVPDPAEFSTMSIKASLNSIYDEELGWMLLKGVDVKYNGDHGTASYLIVKEEFHAGGNMIKEDTIYLPWYNSTKAVNIIGTAAEDMLETIENATPMKVSMSMKMDVYGGYELCDSVVYVDVESVESMWKELPEKDWPMWIRLYNKSMVNDYREWKTLTKDADSMRLPSDRDLRCLDRKMYSMLNKGAHEISGSVSVEWKPRSWFMMISNNEGVPSMKLTSGLTSGEIRKRLDGPITEKSICDEVKIMIAKNHIDRRNVVSEPMIETIDGMKARDIRKMLWKNRNK